MSGLYYYYKNVVRPLLISEYNYSDKEAVPSIDYIKVGIVFNNLTGEEDWRVPMSLKFLSMITGRKAAIKKLEWSKGGGKERRMSMNASVTLRKGAAYDFLEYLIFVVFPLHCRRYGWPSLKVGDGVYNCTFTDLSVFYRQNEDLVAFDGNVLLSIVCKGDKKGAGSLLGNLGVPVERIEEEKK
jgi:ribosomal protein L5